MKLEEIEKVVESVNTKALLCTKNVLTSEEASKYMGITKGYLYKLTMAQKIPHYKPNGKKCYFNREELEAWLQSNRVSTTEEINSRAGAYCMKGGKA